MTKHAIPVMRPQLPSFDQYSKYIEKVDQSRIYSNRGPLVRLLEQRYAEELGLDSPDLLVLCSNATLAIQGFIQLSEIPTWRVQSFTFPATVHAVVQSGKKVILEDIDPNTWMISPEAIQDKTKEGLLPVLPFGASLDTTVYSQLDHLLIDAAASIGGAKTWTNKLKENWGAVFFLHATKSFGIGEGGPIIFGSKERADKFRSWINFGFSGKREAQTLGTNAKLSEIQAAVGLAVLDNWKDEERDWLAPRGLVNRVNKALGIEPTPECLKTDQLISPYWIIFHPDCDVVNQIKSRLIEQSIGTRRWWVEGAHKMPAFRHLEKGNLRHTEFIGARYLGLPFHENFKEDSVDRISKTLESLSGLQ